MLVGCTALATLDLVDCDKIEGSDLRFAICLNPSKDSAPAALQGLLPPVSAKPQKPGLGRPWLALAGLVRVLFEQPRILPRSNPTPQFESAQRFCSPFFRGEVVSRCVIKKFTPPQNESSLRRRGNAYSSVLWHSYRFYDHVEASHRVAIKTGSRSHSRMAWQRGDPGEDHAGSDAMGSSSVLYSSFDYDGKRCSLEGAPCLRDDCASQPQYSPSGLWRMLRFP